MMSILEEPQESRLCRRQSYLRQVEQLYKQIETWGKDKFELTTPIPNYFVNDVTGEDNYQVPSLAVVKKYSGKAPMEIDLFPEGITFVTGDGVVKVEGTSRTEELIYMRKDTVRYTERNGKRCLRYEGFIGDGWYLAIRGQGTTRVQPLTETEFLKLFENRSCYSDKGTIGVEALAGGLARG